MLNRKILNLGLITLLASFPLTGCVSMDGLTPTSQTEAPEAESEPEPIVVEWEPDSTDEQEAERADATTVAPESEPGNDVEPTPVLRLDEHNHAQVQASMSSAEEVKRAFSALHQVTAGAFMESVIERVESIMGLEFGKEGSGRVYRCPENGVFVHSREEFRSSGGGESAFLFEFDNCQGKFLPERMVTLNGSYSRRIQALVDGTDHMEIAYDITGEVDPGPESKAIRLRGTQEKRHPSGGGVIRETPVLELVIDDEYVALVDFREQTIVVEDQNTADDFPSFSSTYETVFAGRLVSSAAGGYVDITTPENLVRSYPPCAATGLYRFTGGQLAEVRFGVTTNTPDRVTIEIDNARIESYPDCQSFSREVGRIGM